MKKFVEGDAILVLDPRLERSAANILALEKILELSLSCLASNRHNRPTMRKCAEILWSIRKDHGEQAGMDLHSPFSNARINILAGKNEKNELWSWTQANPVHSLLHFLFIIKRMSYRDSELECVLNHSYPDLTGFGRAKNEYCRKF